MKDIRADDRVRRGVPAEHAAGEGREGLAGVHADRRHRDQLRRLVRDVPTAWAGS